MPSITIQEIERQVESSGNARVHVRLSTDGGATWKVDTWVDAVNVDPATGVDNGFDSRPRASLLPFWQAWQALQQSNNPARGVKAPITVTLP